MPKAPTWLMDHKHDVYSQDGEDGVIEAMLRVLPERDKWCVEFGAWDGMHLSNSRHLIEQGCSAVLIEGDARRCTDLKQNYAKNQQVTAINRYVAFEGADTLDHLLAKTDIPSNFDFLSIDIDGNDYHVWEAVERYRPKAICIEFNPTVPNEVDFVQARDVRVNQGASLTALVRLGKDKGYELVGASCFNAFFVDAQYFPLFDIADNRPETLRTDLSEVTYIFSGFDGQILLEGNQTLPWHNIRLSTRSLQQMPRLLRKHPMTYGRLGRAAVKVLRKIYNPPKNRAA